MYESTNMNRHRGASGPQREHSKLAFSKRKTYQTQRDVQNQDDIARQVVSFVNMEFLSMKTHAPIDYAGIKKDGTSAGQIAFWFEVKQRYEAYGKYDTLILSLHKWQTLYKQSVLTNKPAYFFARFAGDKIYKIRINKSPKDTGYDICIGGRSFRTQADGTKTRDPSDIEPIIHIPISHMRPIEEPAHESQAYLSRMNTTAHTFLKSKNMNWDNNEALAQAIKESTIQTLKMRTQTRGREQTMQEQRIASSVANTLQLKTQALKSYGNIDYAGVRIASSAMRRQRGEPEVAMWLEAKYCQQNISEISEIAIPLEKWNALYEQHHLNGQDSLLIVGFAQGSTMYIKAHKSAGQTGFDQCLDTPNNSTFFAYGQTDGLSLRIPIQAMQDISTIDSEAH